MKTRHAFVLFSMFAIVFLLIKSPIYAHPSDHVKEAYRALSAGDLEKAETNLQKARFLSPGDARIQYDLGIVLYRKRDYSGAAKQLEFASKSTENSLRNDALHNLGNSFYRCGEFAKAVKAYTGALEVEENDQTRYNLEQAQKRLKEENERQSQLSSQPDQNKKGEQKDKQDQQSGSSGDQQKNGQNQGKQNRSDGRQGDEAKDQSGKEGNQPQNSQGEKPQGDNPSKDKQASGSREFPQPSISSGTNDLNEEQQKERSDVAMKKPDDKAPPPPIASERAKGIKNQKLNQYLIEKILKDMEEREKQAQRHYRVEPNRENDENFDPFSMDARQLADFFERKQGFRSPKKDNSDSQDW